MKLLELIQKVKEKNLSQEQLEDYGDQMSSLFAEMMIEIADLEKYEALFMDSYQNVDGSDASVAQRKVKFKATKEGQRLIVLKRYSLATKEMINSLKSRTFRLIR